MINLRNVNTILFDLDGTLINTEKEFYNSFYEVLKNNYNIEINETIYKECELDKNATLLDTLRINNHIIKNISNDMIMDKVFEKYEEKFINTILSENTKTKFEYLKKLKNEGFTLGLVTTCMRKYLDILINILGIYNLFDCIVAREDVQYLKPDGEAYKKALQLLGKTSNEAIAVEDSIRGIESALAIDLNVVKVDEFTLVKFNENRCLEVNSVEEFVRLLLKFVRCV